jgi:hypothetical protein
MDKNKFWLGGRLFNTASPRLGAPTQRKARPQVGHPNAMQGTSSSWAPQRMSATQMQGTSARPQLGHPNAMLGMSGSWEPKRNARRVRKMGTQKKNSSASWAPQRTSATQGTSARPRVGYPDATQGTSARWAPKHNARRVCKMGAQTKNSSATKTSTQGSTRLKDELEDG